MIGETEITNQIRLAVQKWLSSIESELYKTLTSVMTAGQKIRHISGLNTSPPRWHIEIASLVNEKSANVMVIGNGRLSRLIIDLLHNRGHKVINFSRHIEDQPSDYKIYHTDAINEFLDKADVLIVCSELTPLAKASIKNYAQKSKISVIDIEGYENIFANTAANYIGLKDMHPTALTAEQVKNIAQARLNAIEQTLIWHSSRKVIEPPAGIIKIGARKSLLSKAQVSEIKHFLRVLAADISLEEIPIDTPCDRDRQTPLPQVGDDYFFTRDIDEALLSRKIDLAVHSAKDLPQKLLPGLVIAAVTPSIAQWDCLVSRSNMSLELLPPRSVVGTSSISRGKNVLNLRADIEIADIRGDIPNRLEQLDNGKFDALILACAGLVRLGLTDRITQVFSEQIFPPAQKQGALALVVRADDSELIDFLKPIDLGRDY